MKKREIAFFILLLVLLIISIGSISADNGLHDDLGSISTGNSIQNDSQILNSKTGYDNSINDDSLKNNGLDENSLENNGLNEEKIENTNSNDDLVDNINSNIYSLNNANPNNEILENADLETISTDSDIASNIKVSYPHVTYQNNTGNILIELPEDANGGLRVNIDDVEIYSQPISSKSVQIPIVIPKPKSPILVVNRNNDYTMHNVSVFYNDIKLNLIDNSLKIMTYPPDHGFLLNAPEEILRGDAKGSQTIVLIFPYSAKGTVDVYLDGQFFQRYDARQYIFLDSSKITSLSLGSHTVKAIYTGDSYYLPCERQSSFKVVDFLIDIPSKIVLDHDDCIYAKSIKYTNGTITVYFDGKKIISKKLDSNHEFLESLFDKVSCGEHVIEVKYTSSNFNYSKKQKVTVSYVVDIWGDDFRYGDDNSVIITVPHDFPKKLVHITIDGKSFSSFKIDDDGWIDINVSKYTAGNHTLVFKFDGNKKYYAYSQTYVFSVHYGFKVPDSVNYLDGSTVSLDLPSNAKGNMELYINDVIYNSVKMVKGKASIKVDTLACGEYKIKLHYTGSDYKVEDLVGTLCINPKIISPYYIKYGQKKYLVVKASKDTKGKIIFTVGKKKYVVRIKNGIARLSLKKLKLGEHYIDVDYVGDDGYNSSDYAFVGVLPANRFVGAKSIKILYTSKKYYKVKVYNKYGKLAKGAIIKFKIGKKTFKVKTNKKGIAKIRFSSIAPGKYKLRISYQSKKVTRKLTVKHILKLKKVKPRKYARKLVLTARLKKLDGKYLKGKTIKFKFKGKVYKGKTNKKGVAKVTVKRKALRKLKIGKKITYKAIYQKDVVKRTVKVRR